MGRRGSGVKRASDAVQVTDGLDGRYVHAAIAELPVCSDSCQEIFGLSKVSTQEEGGLRSALKRNTQQRSGRGFQCRQCSSQGLNCISLKEYPKIENGSALHLPDHKLPSSPHSQ
eukprot:1563810-Rhodomonas_salina.2